MNKKEYLDLLGYYLKVLPDTIVNDILKDYEEHFSIGLENNKSEEQISKELGSPELIAKQFLETEGMGEKILVKREKEETTTGSKIIKGVLIALLLVIASPLIGAILLTLVGILISIVAVIFSFIVVAISLFLVGIFLTISTITGLAMPSFISIPGFIYQLSGLTKIFLSISVISFSILFFILGIDLVKLIYRQVKNIYISIKYRILKGRISNEEE